MRVALHFNDTKENYLGMHNEKKMHSSVQKYLSLVLCAKQHIPTSCSKDYELLQPLYRFWFKVKFHFYHLFYIFILNKTNNCTVILAIYQVAAITKRWAAWYNITYDRVVTLSLSSFSVFALFFFRPDLVTSPFVFLVIFSFLVALPVIFFVYLFIRQWTSRATNSVNMSWESLVK